MLSWLMEGFRQNSVVKRAAISVIALYALLLQAFFASAAAIPLFDPAADFICAKSQQGSGAGGSQHHHSLCCILACSATGATYIATTSTAVFLSLKRSASPIVFATATAIVYQATLRLNFAARGPPSLI